MTSTLLMLVKRFIRTRRAVIVVSLVTVTCAPARAFGQTPGEAKPPPFGIVDNSFLVEEAFNQERGVVQNIVTFTKARAGEWTTVFTQEWPAPNLTHQLSYTVPLSRLADRTGIGDVLINYRLQVLSETTAHPAFSPRLSVVLPTGDRDTGFGNGAVGFQVNLPFSKQVANWYFHWNGGFTYTPRVSVHDRGQQNYAGIFSPTVAGSAVWQVSSLLDLLVEIVASSNQYVTGNDALTREQQFTFSPGVRRGWNLVEKQIVVGAALPVTVGGGSSIALLTYFSYEVRFKK